MRHRLNMLSQGSVAIALAFAVPACDKEKVDGDAETTGAIQAAITVGGARHDVTAIHYKVVGAGGTCSDAAIAETTSVLETEALPGGVLPAGSGTHAGADGLFVLPSGNYRVCATPMSDAGPSRECAAAEGTAYVFAEATTEILLVSQCRGDANGGLDTVVALNDPPKINDLDIAPSKFITQCETATITVAAVDPDGDAVTFAWSITASPAGSSPSLPATDAVGSFSTDMPGDYMVQVAVSDVYAASSSLSFPIHVSADNCGCMCPAGFTPLPDGGCAKSYDIDTSLLVNQNESCDGAGVNRYNGCNGAPYGFQWTDVGGAFGSVRQVDVELESGISCDPGSRTASLNGAGIGSFDTVGSCQCESVHGLVSLPNVDVGSYVLGGANSVTIPAPNCEGLSQSDALGGAFARVTVTYSCEASLCADVTCAPQDQCHTAGSCDPGTGSCSNPNAPDGTACDDGEPTTPASVCVSGACVADSCGNGTIDPGEACDDGGNTSGDGCSATCRIEGTGRFLYTVREGDNMLRRFNLQTRTFEDVGPLGVNFEFGELAWEEATGTLWMVDGRSNNGLYTVNIATGASTLVGTHGVYDMFGLGIDPTTGTLYASQGVSGPGFYRMDKATGAATFLGANQGYDGMAYDTTRGQMTGIQAGSGTLYTVNVVDGAGSLLTTSGSVNDCGLAYDPVDDLFWAIDWSGFLYSYDPQNGYAQSTIQSGLGSYDGLTLVNVVP